MSVACELAHLVGLQVAYEVPVDVGGQERRFGRQLLNAAFAEVALSGAVGFEDSLDGVEF